MLIKKFNFTVLIVIISFLFSNCTTVKKAFDPQRKNSSDEFLVEKKLPLSMPPEFNKLPLPQNSTNLDLDQNETIELLITKKDKDKSEKEEIKNSDKYFEEFILDKIKNN